MSKAKEMLWKLINIYKEGKTDDLMMACVQLEKNNGIKVIQEVELLDPEDFYDNRGGTFCTWHTLYLNEEAAHTWRMDWRGEFVINPVGVREWSSLCNEYSEDYGVKFGFQENGEMYEFLDTIRIYHLYKGPEISELPNSNDASDTR